MHKENRSNEGFEDLTAVVMKICIFWVITPCSPFKSHSFCGYRLLVRTTCLRNISCGLVYSYYRVVLGCRYGVVLSYLQYVRDIVIYTS
jgi:hypothetical protein